ncbi:MAG: hypothetical protein U0V70_03595 [Terriglobia bacterium]
MKSLRQSDIRSRAACELASRAELTGTEWQSRPSYRCGSLILLQLGFRLPYLGCLETTPNGAEIKQHLRCLDARVKRAEGPTKVGRKASGNQGEIDANRCEVGRSILLGQAAVDIGKQVGPVDRRLRFRLLDILNSRSEPACCRLQQDQFGRHLSK